jgi:cysteine-rich repeat protein
MKKQKKKIITIIGIVLAISLIAYFGGKSNLSIITIQNIEPFEKTEIWNSINGDVLIKSAYIGSFTDAPTFSMCSSNDGEISISNSYSLSSNLMLSSSMSSSGTRGCQDYNYLSAEFTVPSGKLIGTYSLSSLSGYHDNYYSIAEIYIDDVFYDETRTCDSALGQMCASGSQSKTGTFQLNFTSSKPVKIELRTSKSDSGRSSVNLELSFEKETVIPNGTTINIYRLEENKCNFYTIEKVNQLPTDYILLSDCEEDILIIHCGNSLVESDEQCDDGNIINDDGCSSTCQNEDKPNYWKFIGIIIVLIGFIVGLIFVLRRFKR